MPSYAYAARDATGQSVTGSLSAESVSDATRLLRAEGRYPVSIRPTDDAAAAPRAASRGRKASRAEVIQLSTQIAIMLETGVTLAEALECIASQPGSPALRAIVTDLSLHVQGGNDFSSALARHPRAFPRVYVQLIRASERSGMLWKMLGRAVGYLRDEQDIVRRVRGALTYPAIMLAFALASTGGLLAFVLPRFTAIYASRGAALPVPTQALMAVSDLLVRHWPYLLAGLLAAAAGGFAALRSPSARRSLEQGLLRVPVVGPLARLYHLSTGFRTVGTMSAAGVPLVDCVTTARDLTSSESFRALWEEVSRQIQAGRQMSEVFSDHPLVPRAVAQMLHAGERSGRMAGVMEQIACHGEQTLKDRIADLTRYIEPAMITVMGLVIGGVALALMLPIFTIGRVVSQ